MRLVTAALLLVTSTACAQATFNGDLVLSRPSSPSIQRRYLTVEPSLINSGDAGTTITISGADADPNGILRGGHLVLQGGVSATSQTTMRFGGIDVGRSHTYDVGIGGSLESPDGAVVYMLGEIMGPIVFSTPLATGQAAITKLPPTAGTGSTGGEVTVRGAPGAEGSDTISPGRGGQAILQGADAGAYRGYGSAYGGTPTLRVGNGTTADKNGGIDIGSTGPVPIAVAVGQASTAFGVFGKSPAYQQTITGTTTEEQLASVIALLKAYGWAK